MSQPSSALSLGLVSTSWARDALEQRERRKQQDAEDGDARIKVLAFANGKGGVGKSSLAAAFSAAAARAGQRVLLIELDQQGNNAEDLGFVGDKQIADDGAAQARMILEGAKLQPTGTPRRNLDVLPGGELLEDVSEELYCQRRLARHTGDHSWVGMYTAAIEQVYEDYDLIVLDVAPGSMVLQLQALVAADVVIIPSKSDPSSRKGLRLVARRFREAHEHNEDLRLLGVVLFATNTSATRVKQKIRDQLQEDLAGNAPVFSTAIRHVEAVAVQCRTLGKVPEELADEQDLDSSLQQSAAQLAKDYRALTMEILTAIHQLRLDLNAADEPDEVGASA
ncbi:ParA family protein [Nonomuraea sp. SYSU D8015]|uniref:ParA family protein n=1 Tax=Nonomuraea sp. SYSU D8015 TaxID=2593644 RepID=UPI001660AF8E|nr:ParA family protein [Nonomuraea sp. SYSU D8015]